MKIKPSRWAGTALVLALPLGVCAQDKPTMSSANAGAKPAAPASAGLVNDWLRVQSASFDPWDFGGQFRARMEDKQYFFTPGQAGQVDFRDRGGDQNNSYLLLRLRVHAGYTAGWFGAFAEGQESSSTGDKRDPNLESDQFDLRQGFVTLGDAKRFPLVAKVGRQELAYGGEFLIGTADWNNIGRVFDAVKLRYTDKDFCVDAFVSRPVIPKDNNFDTSNDYDIFSGLYGSTTNLVPWEETQLYFLSRNTGHNSPNFETGALVPLPSPRDIYTLGFRLKSLPGKLKAWDYTVEADYQFGRFASVAGVAPNAVVGGSRDQQAYAVHLDGGYTWAKTWATPRLGFEFNYASGNSSTNGSKHETFDTLYPSTHIFSPLMDLFSWQNMIDTGIFGSIKPTRKLTVSTSYRGFWLASTSDSFYLGNGAARAGGAVGGHNGYAVNPSYGSYIGSELDLTCNYAFTPYASVQGGFGHFFVGNYVKESLSAPGIGSSDANYLYLQTRFNF